MDKNLKEKKSITSNRSKSALGEATKMNEEEAWNTANALTIGFGALSVECFFFLIVCLLILGEYRDWRNRK